MKRTIDNLPMARVAILVALGEIGQDAKTARVRFGDDGVEYQVGGGAQRLRLLDDRPACGKCVRASGLIYRSQSVRTEKRHLVTAPLRLARLTSDKPLRVHARPGRTFDGRVNMELALKRSLIVARRAKVAQFEKDLGES